MPVCTERVPPHFAPQKRRAVACYLFQESPEVEMTDALALEPEPREIEEAV